MKKSLSLLLAIALVISMFASVASAADTEMTAQQKFDALKAAGIFAGINDEGDAGLDQNMNRAQFARVAALLLGLDLSNPPSTASFKDVQPNQWWYEEVEAAKQAKLIQGYGNDMFGPRDNVTIEQMAIVLVNALQLPVDENATVDGASAWAQKYVAAAIKAGLISADANFKSEATRGDLVVSSYAAAEQTGVIKATELTATAAQSGAKKITVTFSRAVTAEEKAALAITLKNGLVPYSVTQTWADDMMSVVLENSFNYPAGDYTVTVGDMDPLAVAVVAEKVTKVDITAANLQVKNDMDLGVKAYNQFGEEVENAALTISAYKGSTALTVTSGTVDLASAAVDDTVVVTAIDPATGVSATKTYKLVAASTVTSMQFGPATPAKDKTRITTSETDLVIPYTLIDQYGSKVTLSGATTNVNDTTNVIGDVYFTTSSKAIVDTATFAVDADGVLTFDAGSTAGTAVITAYNTKSGASTSFQIVVEAPAGVKTFTMSNPAVLVVSGESVKIPFTAVDQFGKAYTTKDFATASTADDVTFSLASSSVTLDTYGFDTKTGELNVTFGGDGTAILYAWTNGALASQISLEVKKAAELVRITGLNDVQTVIAGTSHVDLTADNLNVVDNYGRTKKLSDVSGYDFKVEVKDASTDIVTVAGQTITGVAEGSKTIKLTLQTTSPVADVDNSSYEYTTKVIKSSDVKSFELASIGTVYSNVANTASGSYAVAISLTGKDASGNKVAIDQDAYITTVTSSNPTLLSVDTVTNNVYSTADADGKATVTVWMGATKLAEQEVTVSNDAPVATTVSFDAASYDVATSLDLSTKLTVKDQYGVAITKTGVWASSDTSVAQVNASTGVVDKVAAGEATISFITTNGVLATATVDTN